MKLYIYNLLIALDQLINTIFGGAPDQCFSSRLWRHRDTRVCKLLIPCVDFMFSWQEPNHCQSSFEGGDRQLDEVWR